MDWRALVSAVSRGAAVNAPAQMFQERRPGAVFSGCEEHRDCLDSCKLRRYRYLLWWPTGISDNRVCLGVFANPSTATADKPDPTVTRWINYCRAWGYGWSVTANVRAWRETKAKLVPPDPIAIGPENDGLIKLAVSQAHLVVCGWGKLGGKRGTEVLRLIRDAGKVPHALKLTKAGEPGHPLYLRADLKPFPMEAT